MNPECVSKMPEAQLRRLCLHLETRSKEGEVHNMCDVLDRVENRGKALGAEAKAKEAAINLYKREA